ncbi:MAG TPA: sec-independent translocase [Mycobacteriales bacterium]|jgi:sec-independent protein translocase protein TatB|nr:sec-independent translocase [Mycobacteriales bacterium]
MLGNLGWEEVLVLAILGLVIFGPDRLPKAAADAARMLRELRAMARGAASDLKAELGPELADLDLRGLHPRRFVEDVFRDDDEPAVGTQHRRTTVALGTGERPPYDDDAT